MKTPAILGGTAAFPNSLPLVRPTIENVPGLARRLEQVLESGMLTNGPTVRQLEQALEERLDVPHVVAVSSCTAGLTLTLQALGANGRVVLPSFTFAASAHAVVWTGGTPVWAEIDPRRLTVDPADVEQLVDGACAITATHVYGAPCRVEELQRIADTAGIPLVYDAAHGLGSYHRGRPVGGWGSAQVFSLSPTKVAVAGEGGIVATHDDELAAALRIGRDYGNPGTYDCEFAGLNARMSELHATVALASLEHLDERVARRNELVRVFKDEAAGLPGVSYQLVDDGDLSTYKDLTLIIEPAVYGLTVAQLTEALRAEGIDSRRYYFPPIHRQKAYAHLPMERDLPVTDDVAERVITPPLYSHMTEREVRRVARVVTDLHEHARKVAAVC